MRKILSLTLSLWLLILMMPINVSATGAYISFSQKEVAVNDTLSVTVTVDTDAPIYAVGCVISYDCAVFEYLSGAGAGGNGKLQIIESPSGETTVSYILKFKALTEGSSVFTVSDCRYETLTESCFLAGVSANVTVRNSNIAEGFCGDNALWVLEDDCTLVIKGTGSIDDYKLPHSEPWYKYKDMITTAIVENGITRIGNNSFSGLENLEYIKIYNPDIEFGVYPFTVGKTLTVECDRNSSAEKYAKENGYDIFITGALESPVIESMERNTAKLKATDGYEYSMDGINWQSDNVFLNVPTDEIVYFYQRKAVKGINGTESISNAAKGIYISAPKVLVGKTCIWVKPIDGFEYSLEELIWQNSNEFSDYIVNGESYTVYQRPENLKNTFVAYEGITVTVNGDDKIINPNAIDLVWLRNLIISNDSINNLAADFNCDGEIDARDIVRMKTALAKSH